MRIKISLLVLFIVLTGCALSPGRYILKPGEKALDLTLGVVIPVNKSSVIPHDMPTLPSLDVGYRSGSAHGFNLGISVQIIPTIFRFFVVKSFQFQTNDFQLNSLLSLNLGVLNDQVTSLQVGLIPRVGSEKMAFYFPLEMDFFVRGWKPSFNAGWGIDWGAVLSPGWKTAYRWSLECKLSGIQHWDDAYIKALLGMTVLMNTN